MQKSLFLELAKNWAYHRLKMWDVSIVYSRSTKFPTLHRARSPLDHCSSRVSLEKEGRRCPVVLFCAFLFINLFPLYISPNPRRLALLPRPRKMKLSMLRPHLLPNQKFVQDSPFLSLFCHFSFTFHHFGSKTE